MSENAGSGGPQPPVPEEESELEHGDIAENPTDPGEDPGVDPAREDEPGAPSEPQDFPDEDPEAEPDTA